jgi:hypothetical protein
MASTRAGRDEGDIDVNLARWFADPGAALSSEAEEEDHNSTKKRGRGSGNKAYMFIHDDAVEPRMREALRSKQRLLCASGQDGEGGKP